MSHPHATRAFAEFAAGLTLDGLPPRVRQLLPTLMIDYFRAGAIGGRQDWVGKACRVLGGLSGPRGCAILFSPTRADPVRAAYQNGVIAGSLDWDDSHIAAIIHPGIVIWPAAFAAAEIAGSTGAHLLEAAAAGYEIAIRIGMSMQPDHSLRGFQGTPTCGVFGAAITAGLLLGLDTGALQNALGLAASYASGLSQFFVSGSDVKRLHAGKAAAAGVEIALLARAGMTGPPDAIEGAQGFCRAASDTFHPQMLTDGLGERFWMDAISLKVHAGTVRLQAAIEAIEHICRGGVTHADIAHIEIGVPRILIGKLTWNAPVDQQQAQMSAPFAVAMTAFLTNSRPVPLIVGIDDFGVMVNDPAVRDLASRTDCVFDAVIDAAMTQEVVPARLTVTLHDRTVRHHTVMRPKGCPDNPITDAEVRDRFRLMAVGVRSAEAIEAWLQKAERVQDLSLAADLMS